MIEPRFVISGSGRAGTGYIAAVLGAAGIVCGHEAWFNPQGEQTSGLVGDASWCAVPDLGGYQGIVWHQTRHPLRVIASLAARPLWGPYADLAAELVGVDPAGALEAATALWVATNEACERHATRRWQVEEVDDDLILELAARLGVLVDPVAAKAAVNDTPLDVNAHNDAGVEVGWADLPDTPVAARAVQLAVRYGYLP